MRSRTRGGRPATLRGGAGAPRLSHSRGAVGERPRDAVEARANAPLFLRADGQAYETKDVDALGSRMAAAAGIPATAVGGKLWRIGGTTDLWEALGMERSKDHIKRRGRWKTDIWEVYQTTGL